MSRTEEPTFVPVDTHSHRTDLSPQCRYQTIRSGQTPHTRRRILFLRSSFFDVLCHFGILTPSFHRGLSPPSAHPCPAYIEVPWDQVSISSSGIVLQGMTGFMSAPVPFNEAMGLQLHNGSNHGIIPSSASSRMNPIEVVSTAQQGPRPFKLVHQPEQGVSGNAAAVTPRMSGAPAQAGKSANADAMAPQVVRHRIGTPAVISSADKRRVHPRKYRCHICGRMFTSKANRDRERPITSVAVALLTRRVVRPCSRALRYQTVRLPLQRGLHHEGRSLASSQEQPLPVSRTHEVTRVSVTTMIRFIDVDLDLRLSFARLRFL